MGHEEDDGVRDGNMSLPTSSEIKNTGGGAEFWGKSEEEEEARLRSVWDTAF